MTEKDREIQELRRTINRIQKDYEYVTRSETVQFYLRKNPGGEYANDISALDRGIRDLHKRVRKAEASAQSAMSEAVYYRRKCEALELDRKEAEENRFPLFCSENGRAENEHQEA